MASLLEADIGVALAADDRRLLTYDRFLDSYWPHFSQPLKRGLDPVLVYSEILGDQIACIPSCGLICVLGVIGGSEESLGSDSNHLDKETYENLSARTQYTFSSQRDIIYALFQTYQKRKKLYGDHDTADR